MTIWVNTLVQNEEKYIWYSIASVIECVDKMLVWDTGSTDGTVKIIETIDKAYPGKIDFKEIGSVDPEEFTLVRKEMLKNTKSDWVMILDGDEVWWRDEIVKLTDFICEEGVNYDSIVTRYVNLVGDIYHFQEENAGKYNIKGRQGFLTIRAINKRRIKGLKIDKPHGTQGFYDSNSQLIQDRDESGIKFFEKPGFMHFTNLERSENRAHAFVVPKRAFKRKHEIGKEFPLDYYYPEVFFMKRPKAVPNVWENMNNNFYLRALVETPLRKIKRHLRNTKSGY